MNLNKNHIKMKISYLYYSYKFLKNHNQNLKKSKN